MKMLLATAWRTALLLLAAAGPKGTTTGTAKANPPPVVRDHRGEPASRPPGARPVKYQCGHGSWSPPGHDANKIRTAPLAAGGAGRRKL